MSFDLERLTCELESVADSEIPGASLYRIPDTPPNSWSSYYVTFPFQEYVVNIYFEPNHPYIQPKVVLDPPPRADHYYSWGVCYLAPGEWRPEYSVAFVMSKAMHYIFLIDSGRRF